MIAVLVACTSPVGPDSPSESNESRAETGIEDSEWEPLPEHPDYESKDSGAATGAAFADIDGDGDADLVVAYGNDVEPGPLSVYENLDGSLEESASWTSAEDHYFGHLAVGDLDGDGFVDVVVSRFLGDDRWDEPGGVQVYLNSGGTLSPTPAWETEGFYTFSCALGDVDLDGDLDLAIAAGEPYYHEPEVSRVYYNDGEATFTETWTTETPRYSFDVAWFDADADGDLDLAFANAETPHTIYLSEDGELDPEPWWTAAGADSKFEGNTLDWGDVDGDGTMDLVVSDNDQLGGDGTVSLYCGPDFSLCWISQDEPRFQSAVSLEDVDQDGDLDLAAGAWGVVDYYGDVVRLYRNNDGVLDTETTWSSSSKGVIEAFAWADLDLSHEIVETVSGMGLVEVPGRGPVLEIAGGVAGDGYVSGPGVVEASYLAPAPRDLAVSHWDRTVGNHVYRR
ncbi:MAG TPA: VCBS repeat-containing protein [Myxococcota bacterium]|nr:VCBS repeat-containing protein [Myxococcota bacterium]